MTTPLKLAGSQFEIRPATKEDVPAMTDVFFHSFNAKFWQYFIADTPANRQWWDEAWAMGIDNPTDRSFVVEDSKKDGKVVACSRWMVPQDDGNQERKWPELPKDWDEELSGAFFGGMEANRHGMMGKRPHWFLEMLGVHEDYQKLGIGASLIRWGTAQADDHKLETYLDGSEVGQPYYKRRHNFTIEEDINIPSRPAYGDFHYKSLIRLPQPVASQ